MVQYVLVEAPATFSTVNIYRKRFSLMYYVDSDHCIDCLIVPRPSTCGAWWLG